jgi:hypothetical protein
MKSPFSEFTLSPQCFSFFLFSHMITTLPCSSLEKSLLPQEAPWKNLWTGGLSVGEALSTLQSEILLVSSFWAHCHREACVPFLPTYGQELEKCVLGTKIIPLNGFSHEQISQTS